MKILTTTGVGVAAVVSAVENAKGRDKVSIQVEVTGTATFQLEARASPDAPWVVIGASGSSSTFAVYDYWPFVRINQTAGAGSVRAWIVES